ncbi:hypothetical protein EXIGLDRAFT_780039 [Exidia glandulosa HHB12029]|uniref:Uncharacterized protein n=1 Tax=Exidia glandulosa HHB12029 TaxID=1314781 RepID=A0A165BSB2_EXIGL|nr:hypothetical protein EXIGLDRAFT_780039 [Exidia glandulosa HHB12029]
MAALHVPESERMPPESVPVLSYVNSQFHVVQDVARAEQLGLNAQHFVVMQPYGQIFVRDLRMAVDYRVTNEILVAGVNIEALNQR